MKNLKIGIKIFLGFFCIFALLASIAVTSIVSSARTGSNISTIQLYDGLQMNANDMMHILNETRVTAGKLYEVHTEETFKDISKQLMYCDYRLNAFHEYLKTHSELSDFQKNVNDFDGLYKLWRDGILSMGTLYTLGSEMEGEELASFNSLADNMRRTNLLAHEVLSNTTSDISDVADKRIQETKDFNQTALKIVIIISGVAFFAAILLAIIIMRSITVPMDHMQKVLDRIGQLGDLQIPEQTLAKLKALTQGRDETAQCMTALLTLVNRLHQIDDALSHVANGNLTIKIDLQSEQDTMGLAVEKMLKNLNQKFGTISSSAEWVRKSAGELSEGSKMLADGSQTQMESIGNLSDAVLRVSQKTVENTDLAKKAADLVNSIQENAKLGTEKMNQMIEAATDINTSSQAISNVIKVINDIAFQTNILALNAAVEAARAGQHGKGFAVVADEVRNLATKSAQAAQNSGALIEDTMRKAEMGASIAQTTSESLEKIVLGVQQSNAIIGDIAELSNEQSTDIHKITGDVSHVEQIVQQNNSIASQSAGSAGKISDQVNLLSELVSQFQLANQT